MRTYLLKIILTVIVVFNLASCTSEESAPISEAALISDYNYNETELAMADAINQYRLSIGLDALQTINHISYKSAEHNDYMISNNVVNHDLFEERSQNLMAVLGAVKVNENVAYNYTTPAGALNAWLNSAGHKANIEGDFTHFGVAVTEDPINGKKYYTNIFIKK
ncbi:MAG: CAP domain-containing protein [Flavobacterium sp.]|nr:CAP domain-containing protein [Flavobacterium sp.]